MKSQRKASNHVKLFFQASHAFRIPQHLFLIGITNRGVPSLQIGELSTEIKASLIEQTMVYEQLKPIIRGIGQLLSIPCRTPKICLMSHSH